MADDHRLRAYVFLPNALSLVTGSPNRQWMDETESSFAYRCLPLSIANQCGWDLLCPATFTATWSGANASSSIRCDFHEAPCHLIHSNFGHGILTFVLGYLFRTPQGHNLWIKGPCNSPKDGASPLEGIVETDWAPYTFTMNWKLTRANHPVLFSKGEPIARILPYPRGYLEQFLPEIRNLSEDALLKEEVTRWMRIRQATLAITAQFGPPWVNDTWEKDYLQGKDQRGNRFPEHQTRIHLTDFSKASDTNEHD